LGVQDESAVSVSPKPPVPPGLEKQAEATILACDEGCNASPAFVASPCGEGAIPAFAKAIVTG